MTSRSAVQRRELYYQIYKFFILWYPDQFWGPIKLTIRLATGKPFIRDKLACAWSWSDVPALRHVFLWRAKRLIWLYLLT
jgi:hypothetical protein